MKNLALLSSLGFLGFVCLEFLGFHVKCAEAGWLLELGLPCIAENRFSQKSFPNNSRVVLFVFFGGLGSVFRRPSDLKTECFFKVLPSLTCLEI